MHTQRSTESRVIPLKPQRPIGGAIIDAEGREIPITETMIQRACRELEKTFVSTRRQA
ncbi:PA1571 family protein [Pseudomonas sp. RIT-PI-AD]|uniref:PA1571 family protein n=1 Tax=Pseudomonas sp. RIT-PI-AD TaxID=3035294 RepID=UPI0021DB3DC8|nr:PA1571 family protein [Pseudomonas sp. RIT-PI-AD]